VGPRTSASGLRGTPYSIREKISGSFVNDQQEALTQDTSFSDDQIWLMQVECIQGIVEELSASREAVADAAAETPAY
jgi:hypothetical protein